jgi:anti-sigma factor RsiW
VLRQLRDRLDHAWSGRHMSEYIDGELAPGERRRLERHVERCPECGPMLRALVATVHALRWLRGGPGRSVAPGTIERIRAEDEHEHAGR